VLRLVVAAVVAAGVLAVLDRYVVHPVVVGSASMEPAVDVGDRLLVQRWAGANGLRRGDLVVAIPSWSAGEEIVKRVVGLPGERIACCASDGRLTVDGVPLDEWYLPTGVNPGRTGFDVVLPDTGFWLLGDQRDTSDDSRNHLGDPGGGVVFADRILGPVWVRYWPPQRLGSIDPPSPPSGSRSHG
jgi:signal peptidase I